MFKLSYACGWDCHYSKLDNSEKQRIAKKIKKLNELESTRHLKHGVPFFVLEAGQYRICFEENGDKRMIIFAGNHKQYVKWCSEQ